MWKDQNGKKAMHECKLLGSVSYNLSTLFKCALSMSCTKRPFKCKMPGCNMYIMNDAVRHHEDSLRRREESGVAEASRARICQSIVGSIYQVYKNCVSHFDKSYERQRGNVHICIGVWLEIGCSGCKGGWVQSPVVTGGCRGWEQFFSWNQKINLFHLLCFFYCIFFLFRSLGFTYSLPRTLVLLVP